MLFDVGSRIRKLKSEVKRMQENTRLALPEKQRLAGEKYHVIMKPAVVQLERMVATTMTPPQTPHETWFQATFGPGMEYLYLLLSLIGLPPNVAMEAALQSLRSPANPSDPEAAWEPWKQVPMICSLLTSLSKNFYI